MRLLGSNGRMAVQDKNADLHWAYAADASYVHWNTSAVVALSAKRGFASADNMGILLW